MRRARLAWGSQSNIEKTQGISSAAHQHTINSTELESEIGLVDSQRLKRTAFLLNNLPLSAPFSYYWRIKSGHDYFGANYAGGVTPTELSMSPTS